MINALGEIYCDGCGKKISQVRKSESIVKSVIGFDPDAVKKSVHEQGGVTVRIAMAVRLSGAVSEICKECWE